MSTRPVSIRPAAGPPERFARHRLIDGWDQERLSRLAVAVFGAGALGNEVVKNLALVGAGRLLIVDFDRVETSNLSRSVLFRAGDEERPKAEVAARRATEISPEIRAEGLAGDLHGAAGPAVLEEYDLAIACLDSVDARLGVDRLCRRAGIPWWNGGLGPSACEITRFAPGLGPCYACTLSARTRAREVRRWSCQDGGRTGAPSPELPTTATAASLGAALLVQDALAAVMPAWEGRGLAPGGRLLLEAAPYRLTPFSVARDPRCPEHDPAPAPRRLELDHGATGRAVLAAAGADAAGVEVHLGFDLVLDWTCGCPGGRTPLRPARSVRGRCPECGEPVRDHRIAASLPGNHDALDRPLSALGVADGGELDLYDGRTLATVRLRPTRIRRPIRETTP